MLSNIKSYRTPIRAMRALPLSLADLDSDGVHLNALAGLPYVQGLIDDARYFFMLLPLNEQSLISIYHISIYQYLPSPVE